jgi:hypothetical protein
MTPIVIFFLELKYVMRIERTEDVCNFRRIAKPRPIATLLE